MNYDEDLNKYKDAYQSDFKYSTENHMMLKWYVSRIIEKIKHLDDFNVLSLGIGHQTVSKTMIRELGPKIGRYVIVEGSEDIIKQFQSEFELPPNIEIVNDFFESFETTRQFEVIEMGFVLEHVEDPGAILNRYCAVLKKQGVIFIAVPNAKSLHRLFGHKAGLLDDPFMLSQHDLALGHKRYFDLESIQGLVVKAGLKIRSTEGIFLKPLTTDQIKRLNLSPEVVKAMFEVGESFPEICNGILIEAML